MTTHEAILSKIIKKVTLDPTVLDNSERVLIEQCKMVSIGLSAWKFIDKDKLMDIYIRVCDV